MSESRWAFATQWQLTHPTGHVTTPAFPQRVPTTTAPPLVSVGVAGVGDGVIEFGDAGDYSPRGFILLPFGAGKPGDTFSLAVYGWQATPGNLGGQGQLALWVPTLLSAAVRVLGTLTGVDGSDVAGNLVFASRIAVTAGFGQATSSLPGNAALLTVPTLGNRYLEVTYASAGNVNSMNALYRKA